MLKTQGILYEHGEKAGRLHTDQLKGRLASQLFTQIENTSDQIINTHLESPSDHSETLNFFSNQTIPNLLIEEKTDLEA